MRRVPSIFALTALLLAGAALVSLRESYRGFETGTFLKFDKGTSAASIGRTLAQAGVIRYPWQFWTERLFHPQATLQAGEYYFNKPSTVGQVYDKIARGDVYYAEFTVPEGSNMFEIATALEAAGLMPAADFLRAAEDPSPISDLAPQAKSLEGYLFPARYRVSHWVTPAALCRQMTDQFRKQWKKLAAGNSSDVHQAVTLASLVEKETGITAERPLIAGVFINRLNIGMRLGCDPTTIYAALLDHHPRNEIHKSDLASDNPYNTYQHDGLPPGPITNPGADAIAAALAPADTEYLYFVAKPDGAGHQFSTSLAEHDKAVKEYRRATKKARKAG